MLTKSQQKDFALKAIELAIDHNLSTQDNYLEIIQYDHFGKDALKITNHMPDHKPGAVNEVFVLSDMEPEEATSAYADLRMTLSQIKPQTATPWRS